jgi:hypothetical protein
VLVILPDGTASTTHLPSTGTMAQDWAQLHAIQETVGGEFTTIGDGHWLALVNADGQRLGLPPNPAADQLARQLGFGRYDMVVGSVIFSSRHGDELGDCPATVLEVARQAGVIA